jgi:hypothetical protein
VTTEQDGTPEHGATSGCADDADEERGADASDDDDDEAQPAMAVSAAASDKVRTASRTDARWSPFNAA